MEKKKTWIVKPPLTAFTQKRMTSLQSKLEGAPRLCEMLVLRTLGFQSLPSPKLSSICFCSTQ